jgi:hypothetical protein
MEKSILTTYNELVKDIDKEIAMQMSIGVIISVAFDRLLAQNEILINQNNEILARLKVVKQQEVSQPPPISLMGMDVMH